MANKNINNSLEIVFDSNYKKLHNQRTARLLGLFSGIEKRNFEEQMPYFYKYDCERPDGSFYELDPRQGYLLLFFEGERGILFTTLRKDNDENFWFYNANIGEVFKIIIKED